MPLVFDKICSVHDGNDTSSRMKDHLPVMSMTTKTISFIAYHQNYKELRKGKLMKINAVLKRELKTMLIV